MTVTLALVAMAAMTAYLLAEDWFFQRRQARRREAEMARVIEACRARGGSVWCWDHPTPLPVIDLATHKRLHHQHREVGAEDRAEWSA